MTTIAFKKFIPGIAWFFLLAVLMFLPGKELPHNDWLTDIDFDKVVHMGVFAILVVLFCLPFRKSGFTMEQKIKWFTRIVIAAILWGYATELIQKYLVEGRQYDPLDWLADGIGSCLGYWFCRKTFVRGFEVV